MFLCLWKFDVHIPGPPWALPPAVNCLEAPPPLPPCPLGQWQWPPACPLASCSLWRALSLKTQNLLLGCKIVYLEYIISCLLWPMERKCVGFIVKFISCIRKSENNAQSELQKTTPCYDVAQKRFLRRLVTIFRQKKRQRLLIYLCLNFSSVSDPDSLSPDPDPVF